MARYWWQVKLCDPCIHMVSSLFLPCVCSLSYDAMLWGYIALSYVITCPRHNLSLKSRGFSISAPHILNSLPINIRRIQSVSTFRRHLKKLLSVSLFYPLATRPPVLPDSLKISALYTSLYNYLTDSVCF